MSTSAKQVLLPDDPAVFRAVFLYVGQGSATLLVVPDGGKQKFILVDTNVDKENGGIDVAAMLADLLDDDLDVFVNTHPHADHLRGIELISDDVGVKEIWHSGHVPSKDHKDAYDELQRVIKKVGGENTFELRGTRDENTLDNDGEACSHPVGDIVFNVLAPAEYVKDEIADEKPEDRDRRIHEHCGVLRFSYGKATKSIMLAGDSDRTAWVDHITDYHRDRLPSYALGASHHGSRSFFKQDEDDEDPYKKHMDEIAPARVVISAPKQSESKHGHPHDDAVRLYGEYVTAENILHLGKNRECVIIDIDADGDIDVRTDGNLVKTYPLKDRNDPDGKKAVPGPFAHKSNTGDKTPRRYG